MTIHKGQALRHKTETEWPDITVHSVHTEDLPTFAGRRIAPFAFVAWADAPDVHVAMHLATLEKDWQDTGV